MPRTKHRDIADNIVSDNTVETVDIINGSVTAPKLAAGAVDSAGKIGDNAITTAKILAGNITSSKLAEGVIDSAGKLADNVVTSAKILDGSITSAKLDTNITIDSDLTVNGDLTVDTNTLYVDATNNRVGINNTSPLAKLDVDEIAPIFGEGRGTNSNKFWRPRVPTYAGTNTGSDWVTPFFSANTSSNNLVEIGGGTSTAYAATEIRFRTAADTTTTTGTERMRIDQNGKVTITGSTSFAEVIEKVTITTSTTGTINFDALTQGVTFFNTDQTANRTINFRGDGSTTLDSIMAVGESMTFAILMKQGGTAYYLNTYQIDGVGVTPEWFGGTAPSSGNTNSIDVYQFTIIKTASATYTVLGVQSQYA